VSWEISWSLDRAILDAMDVWRRLFKDNGCNPEADAVSTMQLTAACLRIARTQKDETRVDWRDAGKSAALSELTKAVIDVLKPAVDNIPAEQIRGEVACRLCDVLEAQTAGVLGNGTLALVTAQCLDARHGAAFIDAFRPPDDQPGPSAPIRPGDPIPVLGVAAMGRTPARGAQGTQPDEAAQPALDAHKALLAALAPRTGDPHKRADPVDRTRWLRLAPTELEQLQIRLVWADPWLEPITASTRFGAAVTNAGSPGTELTWRPLQIGTRMLFYDVTPRDLARQRQRLATVLADARDRNVSVLVFPELCVTADLHRELFTEPALAELPLVVAGSYHVQVEGDTPGANVSDVFAYGYRLHTHRKFADFYYDDPPRSGNMRHEHLEPRVGSAGFDLLLGRDCSIVVLICKDVMGDAGDVVRELAPTIVLIPAMSDEIADFERFADNLAADPQGFTLVACIGTGAHAIFGRPSKENTVVKGCSTPGACIIFTPDGKVHPREAEVK
jgi:predicted amidohydrolase